MPPFSAAILDRPLVSPVLTGAVGRSPLLPMREMPRGLEALLARPPRQRSKLWEFGANLHCSIIGTCLTTAELRHVFVKLGRRTADFRAIRIRAGRPADPGAVRLSYGW